MEASSISKILRGKRGVSSTMFRNLCDKLGIAPFQNGSEMEATPPQTLQLSNDILRVLADSSHFALFELVVTDCFRPDSRWIAARLGVSATEVTAMSERLFRLGLLRLNPQSGQWEQTSKQLSTTGIPGTTAALRTHQVSILEKATHALQDIPIENRDQSGLTVAVGSRDIPEVREKIKRFRRSLNKFLSSRHKRDVVYQFSISFFPVSKPEGNLITNNASLKTEAKRTNMKEGEKST